MEKRKISSLGLRIISSLVMVPLVVGAVYFGNPYLFLLLLLTGAMLCWEWSSMIKSANPALYATIYTVCMVISVLLQAFWQPIRLERKHTRCCWRLGFRILPWGWVQSRGFIR